MNINTGKPKVLDPVMARIGIEMARVSHRYPTLNATRKHSLAGVPGEWVISGPAVGVSIFRDLAYQAAQRIGFKGGPEGGVQFWLDECNGDHIPRREHKGRRTDYTDNVQVVVKSDGTKEGYRGRQRIG